MSKVYLAGAMEFAADNGAGWRDQVVSMFKEVGVDTFNPCTDEGEIFKSYQFANHKEFHGAKVDDPDRFIPCMREIAQTDLREIASSDYVLMYITPGLAGGTPGEATCSHYVFDVPVVGVWSPGCNVSNTSGWLQATCETTFSTFEEAVQYISDKVNGG